MAGRARAVFTAHAETAGLEPPPRGALASYAEDTLNQVPALRARCGEDDEERLHALREMETAARDLLQWIADKPAHRPSRAARGRPAPAATPTPTPAQLASTRAASVRDRYRRMRTR